MNKFYCSSLLLVVCTSSIAKAAEKQPEKLQALDAALLLYVADMDKVEQQWLDPLAIENITIEQQAKSAESNQQMNKKTTNHKPSIDNKKPMNKGVK